MAQLDILFDNFDLLLEAPNSIQKIHELILQLAIQGKLVPQDPNDEPASQLLKKIKAEKENLISQGKIKREKPLPSIKPEEIPYELPKGWVWTRLQDIFDVRDGTHDTPKYVDRGIPLVTSKNIYNGKLDLSNIKYISEKDHEQISKRSKVDKYDILFAMIGSIGNPVLIEEEPHFSIKNVALYKYYNRDLCSPHYLLYFLRHTAIQMIFKSSGGVQSFVSLNFLRNYLFPLPSLTEQKRIVAKVDKLMKLCDELESQLRKSRKDSEILMQAVLREAF